MPSFCQLIGCHCPSKRHVPISWMLRWKVSPVGAAPSLLAELPLFLLPSCCLGSQRLPGRVPGHRGLLCLGQHALPCFRLTGTPWSPDQSASSALLKSSALGCEPRLSWFSSRLMAKGPNRLVHLSSLCISPIQARPLASPLDHHL